ncbi:MAG: glycosyltransferase [Prevotella sp.]|nr:glycosyltransferase [Prevotella sp.]
MRKKICFCTTLGGTINAFLVDFSKYLVEYENYDVTWMANDDERLHKYTNEKIHLIPLKMKRGIALDGLKVIWQMYRIFKRQKFDIVQYSTRNAGTYASIAAWMAGIKCRLYCQWGMMFIALKGIKRALLKWDEKLVVSLSTVVESESFSMYETAIKHGIYKPEKASVIWHGSACGVNLDRYIMENKPTWRKEVREELGISEDAIVFGYCGRITRDKGLNELFAAFKKVIEDENRKTDTYLMIIGRKDHAETINQELFAWAKSSPFVKFTGYTNNVPKYYSALDVFTSLSYREGFGLVVIEAAAMGVPGIVSDALGQRDTIEHGKTGYSVRTYHTEDVVKAMNYFIEHPEKAIEMGINARKVVDEKYEQKELLRRLAEHRNLLIEQQALE